MRTEIRRVERLTADYENFLGECGKQMAPHAAGEEDVISVNYTAARLGVPTECTLIAERVSMLLEKWSNMGSRTDRFILFHCDGCCRASLGLEGPSAARFTTVFEVLNLQVLHAAPELVSPAVALQHLSA